MNKLLPLSIKILFLISVIGLIILCVIPEDDFGAPCGLANGREIIFYIFILTIVLPFVLMIIEGLRKKVTKKVFVIILLIFLIILFFGRIFSLGHYKEPSWAVTRAFMHVLGKLQQSFYETNKRYVDTQEEFIEAGLIDSKLVDGVTGKELTDKDGMGIEGGDNNPDTWSVTAYIPGKKLKLCRVVKEGYWFTCDQTGCKEE